MFIERDGDGVNIHGQSGDSHELMEIATSIMPEWLRLFSEKNREYGDNAKVLGLKGQFSDMWRKMGKLKSALWDDKELKFEGADEIMMDLIGHLFLTLQMMRVKEEAERTYAFTDNDAAVDSFIRMVGGDQKAYDMSFSLNPPFGQMVRDMVGPRLEAEQQDKMAARLKKGEDERITWGLSDGRLVGLSNFEIEMKGEFDPNALDGNARSVLMGEEFAEADAAQHGVGSSADGQREALKEPPRRVVTEQDAGRTRYYHQPHSGSDREELALVPKRLVEQMLGEHHETVGRRMDEIGRWALGE